MSIIDKMKAQFSEKLQAIGDYYVDEWEETIYFRVLTLKERNDIAARSKGGDLDVIVETLIARARDADGNLMFKKANKLEMMREVDPDIMADVVLAMGRFDSEMKESAGN